MNHQPIATQDLRTVARQLQEAALAAVEPGAAVRRHATRAGESLLVTDRRYDLPDYDRVFLLAGGKAAVPMATAVAGLLGEYLTGGVVVTKTGHAGLDLPAGSPIQLIEAGHPVPDENSVRGAQAIARLARQATEWDLVIFLLSGGASALLTLPAPGLDLHRLRSITGTLLRSGATINELNAVRKHLSQIKGGHLAHLAAPATMVTLVLSDVVGDPLDVIGSGPTVPDPTTVLEAREVLERYAVPCPGDALSETPKPGDPVFDSLHNVLVGSNHLAAVAAVDRARALGFAPLLLSTHVEGEAREVARVAAALAKSVRIHGDPVPPPACLVWGGETTVTVSGEGQGGRNQELALSAALALAGWEGVLVAALATDGTDGPTDAAGAVATGETIARAEALGLDPLDALQNNDSYPFFAALDDLIRTGPTGTNVNDLLFILVGV